MRATLTFGVGARDETFRTIGVTHLVEHLAMSALPRVHYDVNASVDMTVTEFTVCARPEQVVEFLERVCRSLSRLPIEHIAKEAGVLTAEGGNYTHPTVGGLLHERFGTSGPGLAVYVGPGYDRLTAEHVLAHAGRYFVAGNAVLQLTGPLPPGLSLPLPAGPLAVHERRVSRQRPGPTWTGALVPGVGASLLGRREAAWSAAMGVLADRLEQTARHERGLSYEVSGDMLPLGGDDVVLAVTLDAREGQEAAVARLLWQELRRLADEGPTEAELVHHVEGARELHTDPRYIEADLARAAEALLLGLSFQAREQRLALRAGVGTADVRERLTAGRVFKPPLLARVFTRHARGLRLILMPDGVALREPDGDVHIVRWPDVVAVERDGTELTVFGAGGCQVTVDPRLRVPGGGGDERGAVLAPSGIVRCSSTPDCGAPAASASTSGVCRTTARTGIPTGCMGLPSHQGRRAPREISRPHALTN